MNPHNPTMSDVHHTEELFFNHMKRLSVRASDPRAAWLQSFELQCSDRWS